MLAELIKEHESELRIEPRTPYNERLGKYQYFRAALIGSSCLQINYAQLDIIFLFRILREKLEIKRGRSDSDISLLRPQCAPRYTFRLAPRFQITSSLSRQDIFLR